MIDLTRREFDRLTVVGMVRRKVIYPSKPQGVTTVFWVCDCKCGTKGKEIRGGTLLRGDTTSCGCLKNERFGNLNRKDPGESSLSHLYRMYRIHAGQRKLPFDLTREEFRKLVTSACTYCGDGPSKVWMGPRFNQANENDGFLAGGVDRVDNTKGYLPSNSIPCCTTCNTAKSTMSLNEFLQWVHRVASRNPIIQEVAA